MCDYVVLPLLNSSFEPGRAREVVEGFVDVDLRNIARAELFYFTGQAEECCEITRRYLSSRVIELKLSACILYGYSNLSLGNVAAAKRGMEGIQSCVKIAMKKKVPKDVYASCLLAGYVGAVLLHLPTDGMPAFGEYSRMPGERLRGSCRRWSFLLPCWQVGDGPIRRSESIWGFPLILSSITLRISFAS